MITAATDYLAATEEINVVYDNLWRELRNADRPVGEEERDW